MSVGVAALALSLLAAAPASTEERASFALIIANNQPQPGSSGLSALRYADDDGARFFELFELFAERVVIHTVLDAESQDLYPEVAIVSRPPTKSEVARTLDQLFKEIEAARARGRSTELFFVFVGHGSALESGEGVMHFLDGGFSRSDLFQQVVSRSPAQTNHVIVDACNAFLFVAGRGDEDKRASVDQAVDQYLARETMQRHPNTGFLLSTSASAEVHEWSGFRAGIFSHEVRSAMLGGADIDGNGAVTYDEVRAFLNAANGRVTDPRAKLSPWVSPPSIRRTAPLVERARTSEGVARLHVPGDLAGRWSIEDTRGVRLADINVAPDGPVTLLLSPKRDHYLRGARVEIPLPSSMATELDAQRLARREVSTEARGGLDSSFRRDLFALPFGLAFFTGFQVSNPPPNVDLLFEAPEEEASIRPWIGGSLIVLSVAAIATGIVFGVLAEDDAERFRSEVGLSDDLNALQNRAQDRETVANVLIGTGVALGLGGTALLVW